MDDLTLAFIFPYFILWTTFSNAKKIRARERVKFTLWHSLGSRILGYVPGKYNTLFLEHDPALLPGNLHTPIFSSRCSFGLCLLHEAFPDLPTINCFTATTIATPAFLPRHPVLNGVTSRGSQVLWDESWPCSFLVMGPWESCLISRGFPRLWRGWW